MAFIKMEAHAYGLTESKLFAEGMDSEQILFKIPDYQRPYVWRKENWETLFGDIIDNDSGYFVGAIICAHNDSASTDDYTVYEVVDGQQRLTTLSLFLAAIHEALDARKTDTDRLSQIKRSLRIETSNGKYRARLFPQNVGNVQDYFRILITAGIVKKDELDYSKLIGDKPDRRRLITKAYEYFKKSIAEYANGDNGEYKDEPAQQVKSIIGILKKLNSARLVVITADSHASANTLFEALNNRGAPLTITDLIKNRLFAALKSDAANYKTRRHEWDVLIWDRVISLDGKEVSGVEQERFFRQSYNACRTTWEPKEKFPEGKRANLFKCYEEMIKLDSTRVFEQIKECADIYPRIQGREETSPPLTNAYRDLARINGATSYTLLLYLVRNGATLNLAAGDFEKIVRQLIKFFVRRSFTDYPPANRLDKIFIDFIDEIERENYIGAAICEKLTDWLKGYDDGERFSASLRGNVYDPDGTNEAIRFALIKLAEKHLGKESPDFWAKIKHDKREIYNWTIEHVLPQEPTPEWKKMLADDAAEAETLHADNVNKLGNLTLTAYNAQLGNKPFAEKLKYYKNSPLAAGLNAYICKQTTWDAQQIQSRTQELIEEILDAFKW